MKQIYDYIKRFITIDEREFEQMANFLVIKHFAKKEIITEKGQIENNLYIIQKGLIRKFFLKKNYEVITQIAKEGDIICSSVSFLSQKPSDYVVETMEPCTVYALNYDSLQKLYNLDYKMERLGRLITLHWLLQKEIWDNDKVCEEPRERFKRFVIENNELIRRVPQKYLASYLNIKPETFSRYKHLLKN